MELITKRLHISGLTPQITHSDLQSRFSSFGAVKALDGHGKPDGNGAPRPYAYVTLESTKSQLGKCLNLLSGTTWKGAKLRIGEAKPDFHERIAKEQAQLKQASEGTDAAQPKKRRRLLRGCQGVHAADMSLVTPENAARRAGWHKTPMGRLVRPVRMRPLRPLSEPEKTGAGARGAGDGEKRRKKDVLLTRARRRTIDPMRWGSQYLRGVLLEGSVGLARDGTTLVGAKSSQEVHNEQDVQMGGSSDQDDNDAEMLEVDPPTAMPSANPAGANALPSSPAQGDSDIAREAAQGLALLNSLFGDRTDDEWGDEESMSDIDMDQAPSRTANVGEADMDGFEEVPVEDPPLKETKRKKKARAEGDTKGQDTQTYDAVPVEETSVPDQPGEKVQIRKLKDMFAPRPEDTVFSLLANLDVDLELDDAVDVPPPTTRLEVSADAAAPPALAELPVVPQQHIAFDPSKPLFFPLPLDPEARRPRGRTRDIFDAARERGWGAGFHRTETSDEIRKRWEDSKVELTQQWKKRHREAIKNARRRGGGQE